MSTTVDKMFDAVYDIQHRLFDLQDYIAGVESCSSTRMKESQIKELTFELEVACDTVEKLRNELELVRRENAYLIASNKNLKEAMARTNFNDLPF